jgi:hypothetical protein
MPGDHPTVPLPDEWQGFAHVPLRVEDAVECGFSREAAQSLLRAALPGEDCVTLGAAWAALQALGANGSVERSRAAALIDDILEYRAERARVAGAHQPIRHAKINIKKLLKSPDVSVAQLRTLAQELGWHVREDEEGVTVPVNELIPYFRRPVVRDLLAAKLRQVGRAPAAADEPEA